MSTLALERPREAGTSTENNEGSVSFDPLAVPQLPTSANWLVQDPDDLISLGEEKLFSGHRTRILPPSPVALPVTSPLARQVSPGTATPVVTEELFRSLGAAKHAFLFALNGVLHQSLESSPLPTTPDQSWPSLAPPRRHSIAVTSTSDLNPYSSADASPDALLDALVANLRSRTSAHPSSPSTSPNFTRSLGNSPLIGSTPSSEKDLVMEELQARVDILAQDLAPADADLAKSLASLLSCIERLLSISRVRGQSPTLEQQQMRSADGEQGRNVYLTLEREARALQTNKEVWTRDTESVVGAAREVEIAERELLWGRVDDLSERVGVLCRDRAQAASADEEEMDADQETSSDLSPDSEAKRAEWVRESALFESSTDNHDLPRYSTDLAAHPPAYAHEKGSSQDWEKPPLSPHLDHRTPDSAPPISAAASRSQAHRTSTASYNEKMARDLESVSMAIERLYLVSPQLANQRVDPDRRLVRERQLAKLGNAIERLSRGRLDDQRAIPSPVIPEEAEYRAARLKRMQDAQLDKLIAQIDRAASRTLTDQRVDLTSRRRDAGKERAGNRISTADPIEVQRQEFILKHTGKGRLASQDAVFSTHIVERFPRPPSPGEPVTITEFFKSEAAKDDNRPRSNSFPARPVVKNRFSSKNLFQSFKGDEEGPIASGSGSGGGMVKKGSSSRLVGVFKKVGSPVMSRSPSMDTKLEPLGLGLSGSGMSRSSSAGQEVHAVSHLDFVAEESRNLGTIVVTFWPRTPPAFPEEYEVVSIESNAILVAPKSGGALSSIPLPSRVIPQTAVVSAQGTYHEVKLLTVSASPTRLRPDLEVHYPITTAELRDSLPSSFVCAKCQAQVVDSSRISKYNALPSEHWAELLDAWMCHQDQTLSDDLIAKGKGIKPRLDEGLVGSAYLLFGREITCNWVTPEGSELTRTDTDDVLRPVHCATCQSLIGQHVTSLSPDSTMSFVRILKYATFPTSSSTGAAIPRYSLASHVTSQLLEIGQAHACHRFVIEDSSEEKVQLLLWLFNPAIRITFSSTAPSTSLLLEDQPSSTPATESIASLLAGESAPLPSGRTTNAVKIFYIVVDDENDVSCRDFIDSVHSTPERVTYTLDVIHRLTALLQASSAVYPVEKRKWGSMDAGFLERL